MEMKDWGWLLIGFAIGLSIGTIAMLVWS